MKITTRIVSGYLLFFAILAGLVVYQVITINRMQEINKALSEINFRFAYNCLQAIRDRDLVQEFTEKCFGTAMDPDYLKKLQVHQDDFQNSLTALTSHATSSEEKNRLKKLLQQWDVYKTDFAAARQSRPQILSSLPQNLEEDLAALAIQIHSTYQAALQSMSSKVDNSRKTGETAMLVLWIATVAALAISILVSLLIIRSISKPLAHLTEGTRAIADGKFFYRLDTSRNDEFSELASDFNKMALRLNELDGMKKDFVSHVSHELKAPLASMHETTQLMIEGIPGPLTDKQRRLLELNLQSGKRLTAMISNLLDLSKTEAGVMEYEMKSQDLVPLVRDAILELEPQARERQVRINAVFPDDTLPVECDPDRIVQVILNLVGNAVKFSPRQAEVLVRVEKLHNAPTGIPDRLHRVVADTKEGSYFGMVTVADSGPGIPDSDKEKVFEKFHQVKQGKKLPGQGVGLGLSICRTIVQAHRGAVWVEDNPGGGSRFLLLLRRGEVRDTPIPRSSTPL